MHNRKFGKITILIVLSLLVSFYPNSPTSVEAQTPTLPGTWEMVFNDEFNGTSVDLNKWEPSWFQGNNNFSPPINSDEDGCYHSSQSTVSGGNLNLAAVATSNPLCKKKDGSQASYVSGLVNTRQKFQFTYGYYEARMYLPGSGGEIWNWPAFWSNGYGPWPVTGEIDVMEALSGRQPCWHYHYEDSSGNHQGPGGCVNWSTPWGWHTFAAHWEAGRVTYYYDGVQVGTITSGIVSVPHYLILNNGINDRYGINVPAAVLVDYVRVWQKTSSTTPPNPPPNPPPTPPNPPPAPPPSAGTQNLISSGDAWLYLDTNTRPSGWETEDFNDSTWLAGASELGYGDGDESTVVSFGGNASSKFLTTYFRKSFNVTDPNSYSALSLGIKRDDGAVVYLNGTEVFRTNMPAGTITHATPSALSIEDETFYTSSVNPSLLQVGKNVIAVEVHQSDNTSSDLSFNFTLTGTLQSSETLPVGCKGDYNTSGTLDITDFQTFAQNYKLAGIQCSLDITGDNCYLDINDFAFFGQIYKETNRCV